MVNIVWVLSTCKEAMAKEIQGRFWAARFNLASDRKKQSNKVTDIRLSYCQKIKAGYHNLAQTSLLRPILKGLLLPRIDKRTPYSAY